jgi:hypothetical protein
MDMSAFCVSVVCEGNTVQQADPPSRESYQTSLNYKLRKCAPWAAVAYSAMHRIFV